MTIRKIQKSLSVILGISGIILIAYPLQGMNVIVRIAGILFIIISALGIYTQSKKVSYLPGRSFTFVSSILALIFGITLLIFPSQIKKFLIIIQGIILIINACLKFRIANEERKWNEGRSIVLFICSIGLLIVGIFIIFNPTESLIMLYRLIGLACMLSGIFHIVVLGAQKRYEQENVIDVEVKQNKEDQS